MGILSKFKKSEYFRNVSTLAGGTILAQVILVLTSPVLTRLFTPEEFGLFAVFVAFITSITPAICGKYDVTIVLQKYRNMALHLYAVATYFSVVIIISVGLILVFSGNSILEFVDADDLLPYIYFIVPGLLFVAIIQVNTYYMNRIKEYQRIARSKIIEATSVVLLSIILGLSGYGLKGLVFAYLASQLLVSVYLFSGSFPENIKSLTGGCRYKFVLARKYRKYPYYNATSALLDGITLSLPVFILNIHSTVEVVGFYMLMQRLISKPLAAVAGAVSMVNLNKIAELLHVKGNIVTYLNKLIMFLAIPALILIIIVFSGSMFIPALLGEEWTGAIIVAEIMCVPFAFKFIVTSVATTNSATNNPGIAFVKRIISFLIMLIVLIFIQPQYSHVTVLMILAAAIIIDNLVAITLVYYSAFHPGNK